MQYTIDDREGFRLITTRCGMEIAFSPESGIKIIEVDGLPFKDFLGTGTLLPYEDWRLPAEERAAVVFIESPHSYLMGYDAADVERDGDGNLYDFAFGLSFTHTSGRD